MQRFLPTTPEEKWLLAMGAIYLEENQILQSLEEELGPDLEEMQNSDEARDFVGEHMSESFLRLDMNYDQELRADALDLLQEMWDVHDRASALTNLEHLRTQGHRAKFNALKKVTDSLYKFKEIFKFDFDESEEIQLSDEEFEQLSTWVEKADSFVPRAGILAWDLSRYIHLVRMCFFVGFLSDEEAWQKIEQAKSMHPEVFSSWSEFAQSFLIGRTFWAGQEDGELKSICERLLGHPASPWSFFPMPSEKS